MSWVRLYIVEGQSEREFIDALLTPHLAYRSIDVKPRVVQTNRKLNKRGGLKNFETIRQDLDRLMREDNGADARFTTMIDLYGLPPTFPGRDEAAKKALRADRVAALEAAFQAVLGDSRFSPHIQVHEFETLLYCDLGELRLRIADSDAPLLALEKEVQGMAPEDVNEGPTTAPSKRLIKHLPIYDKLKVRVGAPAAAAIGLPKLRERCPHFDEWVTSSSAWARPHPRPSIRGAAMAKRRDLPPTEALTSNPFAALARLRDELPPGEPPSASDEPSPSSPAPRGPARAVVRYQRKGRGGKEATIVEQLGLSSEQLDAWCREFKRALGCGGGVEGDQLVFGGDQRARISAMLEAKGVRRVIVG